MEKPPLVTISGSAKTISGSGVGLGVKVAVGVAVFVGSGVSVGVGLGVSVGTGVAVCVGVNDAVGVGDKTATAVAVGSTSPQATIPSNKQIITNNKRISFIFPPKGIFIKLAD
jgi:hypothetical protein